MLVELLRNTDFKHLNAYVYNTRSAWLNREQIAELCAY